MSCRFQRRRWRLDGVAVCHEDCGEDLDELTIVDGLSLVPFAVEVHCAQWGTLSRISAAVAASRIGAAVAIDEDTMLGLRGGVATVSGPGQVWTVTSAKTGAVVKRFTGGQQVDVPVG
jgi:cyanophycinase